MRRSFGELAVSPAYQNAAVGFDGDDFINLVVGFDSELDVYAIIAELQRIEALCGRARNAPQWAPRSMDLDVLLYDDLILDEGKLKLPRPDLLKRAYMLRPLADIAPDLKHPVLHRRIGDLWQAFEHDHAMGVVEL
jgi:2-amino-4-hydroxy-6-hydroxymethyldihydropteridine diphosphokinase